MRRDLLKYLLILMLPAIIWLFINSTVNRHNHYISKGFTISHAHPYDKTPIDTESNESHHHSNSELFLLSFISDPVVTASIIFILFLFLISVSHLYDTCYNSLVIIRNSFQIYNYHAPPIL